jgi:hypothetical protein
MEKADPLQKNGPLNQTILEKTSSVGEPDPHLYNTKADDTKNKITDFLNNIILRQDCRKDYDEKQLENFEVSSIGDNMCECRATLLTRYFFGYSTYHDLGNAKNVAEIKLFLKLCHALHKAGIKNKRDEFDIEIQEVNNFKDIKYIQKNQKNSIIKIDEVTHLFLREILSNLTYKLFYKELRLIEKESTLIKIEIPKRASRDFILTHSFSSSSFPAMFKIAEELRLNIIVNLKRLVYQNVQNPSHAEEEKVEREELENLDTKSSLSKADANPEEARNHYLDGVAILDATNFHSEEPVIYINNELKRNIVDIQNKPMITIECISIRFPKTSNTKESQLFSELNNSDFSSYCQKISDRFRDLMFAQALMTDLKVHEKIFNVYNFANILTDGLNLFEKMTEFFGRSYPKNKNEPIYFLALHAYCSTLEKEKNKLDKIYKTAPKLSDSLTPQKKISKIANSNHGKEVDAQFSFNK